MYRWVEAIEEIIIQCRPRRRRHKRRRTTHKSPTAPLMGAHFFFFSLLAFFLLGVWESLCGPFFFFSCVLFCFLGRPFPLVHFDVPCVNFYDYLGSEEEREMRQERGEDWLVLSFSFLFLLLECLDVFPHTDTRNKKKNQLMTASFCGPTTGGLLLGLLTEKEKKPHRGQRSHFLPLCASSMSKSLFLFCIRTI